MASRTFNSILKNIIADSPHNRILINWGDIVGQKNKLMMYPFKYESGVLHIAVSNPMVKTYVSNTIPILLSRLAQKLPAVPVKMILVSVRPEFFREIDNAKQEKINDRIKADEADVELKKAELVAQGISPERAEEMARIEVLIETRNRNNR